MTSTTQKYRALFLSALMVLSVVAVTISFSGAAAANHDAAIVDAQLSNGGTYWQGQNLNFSDGNIDAGETYQIRTNDDANKLVRERTAQQADHVTIDTSGLDGNYNLTWESGSSVSTVQFEVVKQDFATEFNDTTVSVGDISGLEVDSARGTFNVTASADGLDESDLLNIFSNAGAINGEENDDDVVEFQVNGGQNTVANFTGIDPGDYTFEFEVTDTDATANASITVSQLDVTQDFSTSVYEEEAGDIVEITVSLEDTDETWIVVGGDESGWLGAVRVVDDDDDGEVTVQFNTYLAGQSDNVGNAFSSEDDDVAAWANATDIENNWVGGSGFDAGIDVSTNLTDATDTGAEPIGAGDYTLRTTSSQNMGSDGGLVEENDVATLILNERSTTGATVYTAPAGSADADDLSELKPLLTEDDTTRLGDRVVIKYEVSGIYGYLADQSDPLAQLANFSTGEAVNLLVFQTNPGANRQAAVVGLETATDSEAHLIQDPDNNTFYLVLNTAGLNSGNQVARRNMAGGQEWASDLYVGDDGTFTGNNPADSREFANYVEDDDMEFVRGSFSLEATTANTEFDNVNADDQVQVLQDSEAVVSGTTNVAPNSEVSVRLRASGDSPFLKTKTVEVTENGTFSATFDMSEVAVGQEFSAEVRLGATQLVTSDAIVVDEIEETGGERTVVVTRTVIQDSPTPRVETREVTREVERTVIQERTVVQERTVMVTQTDGQPGFGIAVAIVALLAAALLAVRRRD